MSILIKGMEMPISCEKCPLCYDYLNCSIDDSLHMFLYNRHPNCPLIEIPTPHGRLIEEEKILSPIMCRPKSLRLDDNAQYNIITLIADAPTILEAEE